MARRRRSGGRRRPIARKGVTPQLDKAKRIVRSMTRSGAVRSSTVAAVIRRAGISVRTYRTARKALGTKAIRDSQNRGRRGKGHWYAKAP